MRTFRWPNQKSNQLLLAESMAISTTVYFASAIIGAIIRLQFPTNGPNDTSLPQVPGAADIFLTNLTVLLILVAGGFLLALPTILSLILNGIAFGSVVAAILEEGSVWTVALVVGPHGLFELSGIWLAAAIGMSIAGRIIGYCCGGIQQPLDPQSVRMWTRVLLIALGLIAVGGIVEAFLTPTIITQTL